MKRRFLVECAICAVAGLTATAVSADAQTAPGVSPGIRRKVLSQTDGPSPGYVTIIAEIEIDPGVMVARHTHPGIESTYFTEGGGELLIEGQAPRQIGPGDAFQVPPVTPHALQNGAKASKAIGNFIVEKGKPLASPA